MFRQFDGGIEGTHQPVLDNPGDGERMAGLARDVGLGGDEGRARRELRRGQLRLGGDLFVFGFSRCAALICFGSGHERCLSHLNRRMPKQIDYRPTSITKSAASSRCANFGVEIFAADSTSPAVVSSSTLK